MIVYTRSEGKMISFNVDTDDHKLAIVTVKEEMGEGHKAPIMALIDNTIKTSTPSTNTIQ